MSLLRLDWKHGSCRLRAEITWNWRQTRREEWFCTRGSSSGSQLHKAGNEVGSQAARSEMGWWRNIWEPNLRTVLSGNSKCFTGPISLPGSVCISKSVLYRGGGCFSSFPLCTSLAFRSSSLDILLLHYHKGPVWMPWLPLMSRNLPESLLNTSATDSYLPLL